MLRFRRFIPYRREFGIHGVLLAFVHTVIILGGWVEWDLVRIFGYEIHPQTGNYIMLQQGFALSNVIGIVCLVYGFTLALSSSNWSQRLLGGPVWKFLQQGAYVLWVLIVLHTAYFLYLHFQDFHRATPDPNWAIGPAAASCREDGTGSRCSCGRWRFRHTGDSEPVARSPSPASAACRFPAGRRRPDCQRRIRS